MAATEHDLARWKELFHRLFDRSDAHVALLDLTGEILAVNKAWIAFGIANGLPATYDPVGENYLKICESGTEQGRSDALEAYVGLQDVLRTGRPKFTMVYPCHSPSMRRWFKMWVESQGPEIPAVVVAHMLIGEKPVITEAGEDAARFVPRFEIRSGS